MPDYRRVMGMFPAIERRERKLGYTLSGGEQQMLAIGRALMAAPQVLLADELSLGLVKARRGTVTFKGQPLHTLTTDRIVRLGIAQSPEGRRIFPRMTVLENLELGAFARLDRDAITPDLERVFALFPRLRERIEQKGGTLSGGEQQMLAMGRALMARPTLLLLDEPSMGLSPILVDAIFRIIRDINAQGTTILLVEQNARMALRVAHRGYVMQTGRIVLHDAASVLLTSDLVRKTYLGEK